MRLLRSRAMLLVCCGTTLAWACATGSEETGSDDGSGASTSTTSAGGTTSNGGTGGVPAGGSGGTGNTGNTGNTGGTTSGPGGSGAGGGTGGMGASGGTGGGASGGTGGAGGSGGGGGMGGSGMGGSGGGVVPTCGMGGGGSGGGGGASGTLQSVTVGPGLGLNLVDDAYNGTLASMTCVDIVVPSQAPDVIASTSIEVGLAHTWVGDVVIKLVSPTGTVITLLSRPGANESADDGSSGVGDSSNVQGGTPLWYTDDSVNDAEDMGSNLASSLDVVCLDDGLCDWAPNPGAAIPGDLTSLAGEASNGTWQLCVGDAVISDTGFIHSATLHICK